MAVAAAGIAAGAGISALLAGFVTGQVKGVSVHSAATFALVATLLGVVALLAAAIPVRRAVRIDPQKASRSE
jgi:ABC-type antimicrobial peptide transport system permease subunit